MASPAAAAELADLRAARSLIAEGALVLRLQAQHRVTAVYGAKSQALIVQHLQSELQSMGQAPESVPVRAGLAALKAHDRERLAQSGEVLTRLVKAREQTD